MDSNSSKAFSINLQFQLNIQLDHHKVMSGMGAIDCTVIKIYF